MKYILLLIMNLSFVVGFSQTKTKTLTFSEEGFSIQIPANWEEERNFSEKIPLLALRPLSNSNEQTFRENMNVVIENAEGYDLQEYYKANMQILNSGSLENFSLKAEISGNNFRTIIYTHSMGDYNLQVMTYFYFHKNTGFVITCTSLVSTFDKWRSTFESIGKSLVFIEKK